MRTNSEVIRNVWHTRSNIVGCSTWVRWVVSTNIMQFNESEYHFACRRKDVHLCFIMSPDKMIFAVLELWLSPLQWVLNRVVFVGGKPGNSPLTGSDLSSDWFVWKLRGMERGRGGKVEREGWGRPPALLPPPTGFCLKYHPGFKLTSF